MDNKMTGIQKTVAISLSALFLAMGASDVASSYKKSTPAGVLEDCYGHMSYAMDVQAKAKIIEACGNSVATAYALKKPATPSK